ncbi:hypothetical protein HU200_059365 [Digitaria exilis]|uniref:Uncharacterized protein n=1 Tax=Digitaria exilis TaxID=1010633 RepID=A0A835AD65_9POAL|nr:hypothetical protein HU200_059365 [Digitaria exilis]
MADVLFVVLRKVAFSLGEGALAKIGTEVVEAAPILLDFEHSLKQIEGELSILQAFIGQVRAQKAGDKAFDAWLDIVRDVAHEVEDIIDEYAYLTTQAADTGSFFKRKFHQVKNFAAWQKLPIQISQVEARIQRLAEMRNRYGISVGQIDNSNKLLIPNLPSDSAYLSDNSEMVGHAVEIGRLTEWLLEEKQDRTLIAILGMGGLGKTTVASSVYKNQKVRRSFDCYAWVTLSQMYQVEELLREIIHQLLEQRASMPTGFMTMNRMRLVETIQSYLRDKKYLIVLDDVWDKDAWLYLNNAFVRNNCGSKVLITTRRKDVSYLSVHNRIIELKTLNYAESWELFCKKAFYASKDNTCPMNLRSLSEKIVDKCQGLPLAIVAIGSILSYRELDEQEWAFFYNQLSWQLANNPELSWIANVLNLSLNDLPCHLRSCFLYCSLFPEDHRIKRKFIIKLWIAEGLVEDRGDGTTMEEVAEHYLLELTQRSLLQVTERNSSGRARTFLMHDLVREVTSITAAQEKFAVIHGAVGTTQVSHEARRLCVQKSNKDLVSQLGNLTMMRSLTIMNVRQCYIQELWNSLTKMPNLSTLTIFASDIDEILNLRKLKPLPNLKLFWLSGKMEGGMLPPIFAGFEKLTQLKMDWSGLKKDPISSFCHMSTLVDLWLYGAYGGEHLSFCAGWFPNLKSLQLADMEHLSRIGIDDGTMTGLYHLDLIGLRNLKAVPTGIKCIRKLHQMFLTDMPNEFIQRLQGSDSDIVQHIPNIHIFYSYDSKAVNSFHFVPYLARKCGPGATKYARTYWGSSSIRHFHFLNAQESCMSLY